MYYRDPRDPVRLLVEEGRTALVVGAGRSGRAAAGLLSSLGCPVVLNDRASSEEVLSAGALPPGVLAVGGGHPPELFARFPLVVVSPGVPQELEALAAARRAGALVLGEMELAWRLSRQPWAAVTGTNGKSTTTSLLGEMLREGGMLPLVGGNLGVPVCELLMEAGPFTHVVSEVSSFQLEQVERFRPRVGVMLNLTPDHLDRYRTQEEYFGAKARLFARMGGDDLAVVNADDPRVMEMARSAGVRTLSFSRSRELAEGACLSGGRLVLRRGGEETVLVDERALALAGGHNRENALAAAAAASCLGVEREAVRSVLESFSGLPHRMELVGHIRGVPVYNDSKATNVGAALSSVEGLRGDVILIAGGKDKGTPYAPLRQAVGDKVSLLILLGEAAGRMEDELGGETEILRADSLEEAVQAAVDRARPGNVILLAPACSSFDMFSSFEERGDRFRGIVRRYMGMR